MVVEQFGRIAERIVQLKLGRFLHGASAIYLLSVMGLVLWGALIMQEDLSHGNNNIRPAIPVMEWIYRVAFLPLIAGDAVLYIMSLPSEDRPKHLRVKAAAFIAYELVTTHVFVWWLLVNFSISSGVLEWRGHVNSSARGF